MIRTSGELRATLPNRALPSPASRSTRGRASLVAASLIWLIGWVALIWPRAAHAQTWGQYLIVLDDSGSMDGSDPDRRVMLASLALVEALGDADQVMIVGLNELAAGGTGQWQFMAPRELLRERDAAEGTRELVGPRFDAMARHQGATPCKAALAQAKTILESVAGSGTPQTLLMLTDGACSEPVEPAETWLSGLTSHAEARFRFVLLSKPDRAGVDAELVRYASATGWTGNAKINFDVRSLLQAFADVLAFSRGLRFDDGGRGGLSRSFAGAREVRVLAISESGQAPIHLAYTDDSMDSRDEPLVGGPTFRSSSYGWSLRAAKTDARSQRISVHSSDVGVEVLVIPSYGLLHVEATIAPCGEFDGEQGRPSAPPLPWTRERAVRAGQPACAWARLVGDTGDTIHPLDSFPFEITLCEDQACTSASAMQPSAEGSFNAQLGVFAKGRHERWFRAAKGSLARPLMTARAFAAMAFGVAEVRRQGGEAPIDALELGVLPQPGALATTTLEFAGSFPAGSAAELACELGEGTPACFACEVLQPEVVLQDPFRVELRASASPLCPALHESDGEAAIAATLVVRPKPDAQGKPSELPEHRLALRGELRYAVVEAQTIAAKAGDEARVSLQVPAPVGGSDGVALEFAIEPGPGVPADLIVEPIEPRRVFEAEPGERATIELRVRSPDCCDAGEYPFTLVVSGPQGATLRVPVTLQLEAASFWTCPGKQIALGLAGLAAIGLVVWLIRGFTSPAKFADAAVLVRAESHEALVKVVDGDEDWRLVRALEPTARGFYKPATIHFGGSSAALPSLRGLPDDAAIEARPHGNAALVVKAEGIEQFKESTGWQLVPVGQHPIGSSIVLRRDDTYMQFRR